MTIRLYQVHGADRESGEKTRKTIEASSASDAEVQAQRLGMVVLGVEIIVDSTPPNLSDGQTNSKPAREQVVWRGTPSQWSNFWTYVGASLFFWIFLIPVLVAIYRFLVTNSMQMTLTSERFRMQWGVLSKRMEEIELYRVRDSSVHESFIDRIFGIGTVTIHSADHRTPKITLRGIHSPRKFRELIRKHTEIMRHQHRVRDIDVS